MDEWLILSNSIDAIVIYDGKTIRETEVLGFTDGDIACCSWFAVALGAHAHLGTLSDRQVCQLQR
jgi:hypothetical protein